MNSRNRTISRRAFGLGAALAGFSATFGRSGAFAAPADASFGNQAEWEQKYTADARLSVQRATTPMLSPQTIAATERAIQDYRGLAEQGGWDQGPSGQSLKMGSRGPAVVALRQRLTVTGDLDAAAGMSPVFDSYVQAGVQRFQARHGIGADVDHAVEIEQGHVIRSGEFPCGRLPRHRRPPFVVTGVAVHTA